MIIDTKKILADSLISLSDEIALEKITVQMIVKNCNAGRQTFYNHFKDKYDLINWIYETRLVETIDSWSMDSSVLDFMNKVFRIFWEHKEFYRKSIKIKGQNSFPDFLVETSRNFYINHITAKYGADKITKELLYAIDMVCYGGTAICVNWIQGGLVENPEYIARQLVDNYPSILKEYMEM